ncbi:MAG TPA: O-antigen ligase family protein [Candidatus Dormibacteraeota bacterium]|nr:O-antigen ligase family protein [Candidatus Dormibacteraeota bacterium]
MIFTATRPWWRPQRFDVLFTLWLVFSAAVLIGIFALRLGEYLGMATGILLLFAIAVRWPIVTAVFLVAFTPIQRFVIMLLYHFSHSVVLTKGVELWKEAVLAALVSRVIYDLFFRPERSHAIRVMDILVLFFVGVAGIYVFYPGPLGVDLFTRLQGFRTDATFMAAYWAGRGLHIHRRQLRWILMSIVPGAVIVGLVAIWQFVTPALANRIFDYLGYTDFNAFSGATGDTLVVRARDLPGAAQLPRASSLALSDLALAFFQLLLVSMSAALFSLSKSWLARAAAGGFLALMAATMVLTLTRSAIAAAIGAVIGIAIVAGKLFRYGLLVALGGGAVAAILISGYIKLSTIESLTNFQDASSVQHDQQIAKSIQVIEQYPFGRGLGTAGVVAQTQLKGGESLTNESWYLQLGTEIGVIGMGAYLLVVVAVMLVSLWYFWRLHDHWLRLLTLTVAGAAGAFLVSGNFLHAWENTPVSMVFWLFAGLAMRACDLEAWDGYWEQP